MGHKDSRTFKKFAPRTDRGEIALTPPAFAAWNDGVAERRCKCFQVEKSYDLLCLFCSWLRCEGFGFFDEQRETGGILHSDVGEHFAIERDSSGFEAVNQLTVRDAVLTSGCADALNPQAPILTLLNAAIAKRVTIRAICRFLCGMIELALGEKKTLCPFEIFLTPCTPLGAAFYASHGICSF